MNCCSLEGLLHLGNIIFGAVGGGETAEVQMDERKSKIIMTCCMINNMIPLIEGK